MEHQFDIWRRRFERPRQGMNSLKTVEMKGECFTSLTTMVNCHKEITIRH